MLTLTLFCCCGWSTPQSCATPEPQSQPSLTGAVVGAAVGVSAIAVGTAVLIHVHKTHHNLKGCVIAGQGGLELVNDGDKKTYALAGITTDIKIGDKVHIHGDKVKKAKDSIADQTFEVDKLSKDYGPCKVMPATATP